MTYSSGRLYMRSLGALTALLTLHPIVAGGPQEGTAARHFQSAPVRFRSGRVRAQYATPAGERMSLSALGAKPLSLATADINHDGYPDLAVGYALGQKGLVVIHLANAEAFSPQSPEALREASKGSFPEPFLMSASVLRLPARPDILALGEFVGDGSTDLLFAALDDTRFYVAFGYGQGGFGAPQAVEVGGKITALATGALQAASQATAAVVGVDAGSGPMLAVYEAGEDGLERSPQVYPVRGPVSGLSIGNLDGDGYPDVAITGGGELSILHGNVSGAKPDRSRLEVVFVPFGVRSAALGRFVPGSAGAQIAVLGDAGQLSVLRRDLAGGLPRSRAGRSERRLAGMTRAPRLWEPGDSSAWVVLPTGSAPVSLLASSKLVAGRLSSLTSDDLMVVGGTPAGGSLWSLVSQNASGAGPIVAALPMRLNAMGSLGLVTLSADSPNPLVSAPQPNVIYNVATLADSQAGTCSAPSGSPLTSNCTTLRAAVIASNGSPGPNEIVFSVNGTITLSVVGQDDNAQAGDLDVTNALTIIGNGTANTVIQGGPGAGHGIDKVFSFNPLGVQPGFAVSISGLTIRFGTNPDTGLTDGNNEGGAFDFDAGAQDGAGSLSIANCVISQNSTVNGDGGAIALFDGGTIAIANTTITGNQAGLLDPAAWYGFYGGGIYICGGGNGYPANISISNSSVSNNIASNPAQTPPAQLGGGIYSDTAGIVLQGTTISGNTASSDGGGLYGDGFAVGPGTVISGNVSGGNGGGVYGVSGVTGATLANNSVAGWGAALFAEAPGTTIRNSRIVGNTSANSASAIDGDDTRSATVAASNNWWGSNTSPASQVNSALVTFAPWLVMTLAAPSSIYAGATGTLTASIAKASDGSTGVAVADGTPVAFSGTLGTLSPGSAATLAGSANSTYTAGSTTGAASVSATIDSQTLTASFNVNPSPAPTLSTLTPTSGIQGTSVPVTLTGTNFVTGASVAVSNTGIGASGSLLRLRFRFRSSRCGSSSWDTQMSIYGMFAGGCSSCGYRDSH
jgi:hypothetical protein